MAGGRLRVSEDRPAMIKKPAKTNLSVLGQACKLIPGHLVAKLARKHGVDKRARTFSPWSHVVSLLYAQLRYCAQLSDWPHSFTRLLTMIRGTLWDRISLIDLLNNYGTAGTRWRMRAARGNRVSTGIGDLMLWDSHRTKRHKIDNFEIVECAESAKINVTSSPTAHHPHPVGWL